MQAHDRSTGHPPESSLKAPASHPAQPTRLAFLQSTGTRMTPRCFAMLLALLLPTVANAASFNCKLARSKAELLVCSDKELSALDDELAQLFSRALKASPNKREFRAASEAEWKRRETTCIDRNCVHAWYLERQSQLALFLRTQTEQARPATAYAAKPPAPKEASEAEVTADSGQALVACLSPLALLGTYSSFDGGRSIRSMLVACPSQSRAWVERCVAQGDSQDSCTFKVAAVAQDTLKALKR